MDFNLLNLLWGILLVPITFLINTLISRSKRISMLEREVAVLKASIVPLSADIKALTKTIAEAQLSMEQRMYSMAIDNLRKPKD